MNLLTKIKLRLQLQKGNKSFKYLTFETLGNVLIYISGILPFIHVLFPDDKLEEKFFGYSSIHRFLYSAGTHASLLFLVSGLLILIPILSKDNIEFYKINLKYSLLSPFICGVFFMSWVFIPGVDFNILAYLFIGLCISAISVFLILKLMNYIKLIKISFQYKERLLEKGLDFINSEIKK